jgi:C4-dicarboxylate transporter DctM subunit
VSTINKDTPQDPAFPTTATTLVGSTGLASDVGVIDDLELRPDKLWSPRTSLIVSLSLWAIAIVCIVLMFSPIARETKGLLALLLMMDLLFLKIPVGIALAGAGIIGIVSVTGTQALSNAMGSIPFVHTASWSLSVLPMFILMGLLLWRSGVTAFLYDAAKVWLGWLPGGLAVTTNAAGAGLGAVSGSTIGITFALSRLAIPEMLRAGYDRRLAVGAVGVSGLAGQLIPPSVMLVIYAGLANTPVGVQLISGLVPGVLLALAFILTIIIIAGFIKPSWAPKPQRSGLSIGQKMKITAKALPVLALAAVVVLVIYTGFGTANEAAAFGAAGAALLTVIFRRREALKVLGRAILDTAVSCAAIFLMLVGAGFLTRLLSTTGLSVQLRLMFEQIQLPFVTFMLLLMVGYFILGMFLDTTALVLLTVPILIPILDAQGVDLIWFGIFITLMAEMAMVTPPVGVLTFIVHKLTQDPEVNLGKPFSLGEVFRGFMLFMPLALVLVIALIFFPEIVSWLPSLSAAK